MTQTTIDRATLLRETIQAAEIELRELETKSAMDSRIQIANSQLEQMRTNLGIQKTQIANLDKKIVEAEANIHTAVLEKHKRAVPGGHDTDGAKAVQAACDAFTTLIAGRLRAIDVYENAKIAIENLERVQPKILPKKKSAA